MDYNKIEPLMHLHGIELLQPRGLNNCVVVRFADDNVDLGQLTGLGDYLLGREATKQVYDLTQCVHLEAKHNAAVAALVVSKPYLADKTIEVRFFGIDASKIKDGSAFVPWRTQISSLTKCSLENAVLN